MSAKRTINVTITITGDIGVSDRSVIETIAKLLTMTRDNVADHLYGWTDEAIDHVRMMFPSPRSLSIAATPIAKPFEWTGPRDDEISAVGNVPVNTPPERWPYGPLDHHQAACCLRHNYVPFRSGTMGQSMWCDCEASAADDTEYG